MYKIFISLALLLPLTANAFTQKELNYCNKFSEAAEVTMLSYQLDIPIIDMIDIANDIPNLEDSIYVLIIDAYTSPKYNEYQNVLYAVNDFKNQKLLYCLNNY
jgi:hypothetical protein